MLFKANQMPPVLGAKPLSSSSVTSQPMSSMQQPQIIPPAQSMGGGPPMPVPGPNFNPVPGNDIDLRAMAGVNMGAQPSMDPRQMDPRMVRNMDQDMRAMPNPVPPPIMDPRNQRQMQPSQMNTPPSFPSDPRQRPMDPRLRGAGPSQSGPVPPQTAQQIAQQQLQNRLATNCGLPNDASDQEKAALIMQVLQLTDEQISQLPPEQRTSILVLKEQIAKSTQR